MFSVSVTLAIHLSVSALSCLTCSCYLEKLSSDFGCYMSKIFVMLRHHIFFVRYSSLMK